MLTGGVVFGDAGGSGTATSNSLDSYEEGTWTPEIVGSTTAGSYSNAIKSGSYTKVGRLVTATFTFYGDSGTGAGNLNITGFPFSVASVATCVHALQWNEGLSLPSGTGTAMFFIGTGTTAEIRCNSDTSSAYVKMQYPTTAGYVRGTITYETS